MVTPPCAAREEDNVIEAQLREHFAHVAATGQPPAAISTGAAKQRARRSLGRRRAGAATLSAGTVVAAVLVATLAGTSSGHPSRPRSTSQASVQPPGPVAFDVATSRLSFAWLPRGMRVATRTSSATGLSASLAVSRNLKTDAEAWTITVFAAGHCRLSRGTLGCGGQPVAYPSVRAPDVRGGIAYWSTFAPNTNFASLSFEYAANSWANIVYFTGSTTKSFTHASRAENLRLARGLTLTHGLPVTLPLRLVGLPGWRLTYTEWAWMALSGGTVSAGLSSATGAARPGSGRANIPSLVITRASERQTCAVYPPAEHLVINGYPVVIETQTVYSSGGPQSGRTPELESQTLCAPDAGGLMITLTVTSTDTASLTSVFSHLRPGPDASKWTGEPTG
jgi:hypothetical protein